MITIKLIDPINVIESRINESLSKHVNGLFFRHKTKIRSAVLSSVASWIEEQPEVLALRNNSLAAQLGLPRGTAGSVVERIVNSVVNATEFTVKRIDKKLNGGMTFNFQPDHFANLLGIQAGHVITEQNQDLHWLRWLLEEGNRTIVVGYEFIPNSGGRSGGGVMRTGRAWRIPPQYSGTQEDNFITRAFSGREKQLENLFANILGG